MEHQICTAKPDKTLDQIDEAKKLTILLREKKLRQRLKSGIFHQLKLKKIHRHRFDYKKTRKWIMGIGKYNYPIKPLVNLKIPIKLLPNFKVLLPKKKIANYMIPKIKKIAKI